MKLRNLFENLTDENQIKSIGSVWSGLSKLFINQGSKVSTKELSRIIDAVEKDLSILKTILKNREV